MAGPETALARGIPEIDVAQAIQDASANPVLGQQQYDVPTAQAPQVGGVSNNLGVSPQFQVQDPGYGWAVNDNDLGQGQVQRFNMATGMVPVAEKKMPFGAIASRQQFNAKRRMELEDAKRKAMDAFDPMKGIKDPFDTFKPAFNEYTRNDWNRFIKEQADARFAGDMSAAYDWAARDPEGRMATQQWSRSMSGIAEANKWWGDTAVKHLTEAQMNNTELDPEIQQHLQRFISFADPNTGAPLQGADPDDYLLAQRDLEQAISKEKFFTEFAVPKLDAAMQELYGGMEIRRDPKTGKIIMTETQYKSYKGEREALAREMERLGLKDAKQYLDKRLPDDVVVKNEMENPVPPRESSGSKDDVKTWVGGLEQGKPAQIQDTGEDGIFRGTNVKRAPVGEMVNNRRQNMGVRSFLDPNGGEVRMKPRYIEQKPDGSFVVVGEQVDTDGNSLSTTSKTEWVKEGDDWVQTTRQVKGGSTWTQVPVTEAQMATVNSYFGEDWQKPFNEQSNVQKNSAPKPTTKYSIKGKTYTFAELQELGYTPEQVAPYMTK